MDDLNEYFRVLGIGPDATQEEINRAFRKMSHAWHPDKFPVGDLKAEAEEMQRQINNAYARLRNYRPSGMHQADSSESKRPANEAGHEEKKSTEQKISPPNTNPSTHPRDFAKHLDHDGIVAAIHDAEHKTTGEIRVNISPKHVDDAVAAAQSEFLRLGMNRSPERNGVLIFVAPRAHKFAVVGDEAVHAKCGDEFWRKLADAMSGYFKKSEFTPGIIHGVQKAGELLAEHFPRQRE